MPTAVQRFIHPQFIIGIVLSLAASIVLLYFHDAVDQVGSWGYLGVFVLLALSSATVFCRRLERPISLSPQPR